ncbi:type II toxin-antitoxin system RelE/ParE family toxin [Anaerotruncus rubiinfantis]|uniref:type II toxin-antitoxin system RelE/ParE family toxin n=1 Tax=Anaerotruncus rubiinfantis TaxID=1720200 RepID=UPI002089B029|nr:hypothetical protein CE91St45_27010 [Oscillospiraceae bacterium]
MRKIYLYTEPDGGVPFLRFLAVTDEKMRQKLRHGLYCLARFPDYMTEPHVKHFNIERYKDLYEFRERIRILVRIIFTLDAAGNVIILHPFVKKHDRNTMQALESSLRMLHQINNAQGGLTEYQWKEDANAAKTNESNHGGRGGAGCHSRNCFALNFEEMREKK